VARTDCLVGEKDEAGDGNADLFVAESHGNNASSIADQRDSQPLD